MPTIVLPNVSNQFDNTQRIEVLKLGKKMNLSNCSRVELLGAVNELLADRDLIERVKSIRENMRKRDELSKLSNVLSNLIEKRRIDEDMAHDR